MGDVHLRLKPNCAKAYNALGNALAGKGLLDEALAAHRKAINLQPNLVEAYNDLGNTLIKKGVRDEAIAAYREAICLDPNYVKAHYNLGNVLADKALLDEAIAAYREAIHLKPDFAEAHNNLGTVLADKGLLGEAIAAYQVAIRLRPNYAEAHSNLAWLLATCPAAKWRDPRRAVELAKKAVALGPNGGSFWNTLGVAHYRAGDCKAAIEALEKARQLRNGGRSSDFFFLAMAHWRLGNKPEARKWYDRAVEWMEKKPKNEELRRFCVEAAELLGMKQPPELLPPPKSSDES